MGSENHYVKVRGLFFLSKKLKTFFSNKIQVLIP